MTRSWPLIGATLVTALALVAAAEPTWSAADLAVLRGLWIGALGPPPLDPSNKVADNAAAADLGRALFSDSRLSANGQVSCASCHQPDHAFTDALPTGHGVGTGNRRTMPIAPAVYSPWQFWDGRADSLWSQALGPMENPVEHGFTRTEVARVLAAHYRDPYEQLFGSMPDMADHDRFPIRAAPGGDPAARAAWATMTDADRILINRVYANFSKAVAAYERTLKVRPSRFDDYLAGVFGAPGRHARLSPDEVAGLRLFIGKGQCSNCHNGPLLSNHGFANTGVPARKDLPRDLGRAAGVRAATDDPFNCRGVYSDAPKGCEELAFAVVDSPAQVRAYKVPSLRGVGQRAPYMHAGQFSSLEQVVDHYSRAPPAPSGTSEIKSLRLGADERRQIVAFLRTLDEQPPPSPKP
uniref:Di-haem cytochrome c peroxidase n=1 Tax=Caulobacter sp. (strain K31) TaxID=366602 RepID=B0SXI4_CAUSK